MKWGSVLRLVQAGVSLFVLGYIFSRLVSLDDLRRILSNAQLPWVFCGIAAAGVSVAAGVARWRCILRMHGFSFAWKQVAAMSFIGLFGDLWLLGATGGDALKMALVAQRAPNRRIIAAATVLLDHAAGLLVLGLAGIAFSLPRMETLLATKETSALMLFFGIYLAACLSGLGLCLTVSWGERPSWLPFPARFLPLLKSVQAIFRPVIRNGLKTTEALGWSVVGLFGYFAVFLCAALALRSTASSEDLLAALPLIDVLTTLPVAVNGIGVREGAFAALLGPLAQVGQAEAVSISVLGFLCLLVWNFMGGFVLAIYRPSLGSSSEIRDQNQRN